jgi:S1-C subfamily serine protease
MIPVRIADALQGAAMATGGAALRNFGFSVADLSTVVSPKAARQLNITGVAVSSIDSTGPAADQLMPKDIIVQVGEVPITSPQQFDRIIKDRHGRTRFNIIRLSTGQQGYLDLTPRK